MSVEIRQGDVLARLREIPDGSVNCCVTSPPYWGLRDYGVKGQIGLEATPEAFVARMVEVFREVRRVLRPDGTCWINIGDSYAGSCMTGGTRSINGQGQKLESMFRRSFTKNKLASNRDGTGKVSGLKAKDLVGIPWRVAFALQADGWWLRSEIIWHKPNPMPESVTDRPTKAHEQIFLMTKSAHYAYDAAAIAEAAAGRPALTGGPYCPPGQHPHANARPSVLKGGFKGKTEAMAATGQNAFRAVTMTRNKRTVWTITPKPYKEAHFATFPIELPETCILAGCPPGGLVLDPFSGAATTGLAAIKHGRDFIGIELSAKYCRMAAKRLEQAISGARDAAASRCKQIKVLRKAA
jgi:DNA modification methylase